MDTRATVLQEEYQQRFQGADRYRDAVWKILCDDFFSRHISKESALLDLGAGWGEFSRNVRAAKKYAMDLNPECGSRVAGHSTFLHQDCSSPWPLQDGSLDIVFTSNFLEHLPSKALIDKALQEAFRCLKVGGKIICLGPNIKYVPGAYWDYWDHYIPITDASMAEALSLAGFNVVQKLDRFLPYTMSGGKNPPLVSVRLYLKMKFVWRFLGKQFLVIAEKV
ncbi:MAG: class I SAM-dependent methyltransferase [Pseudomonas sp.]|uniref:class I SAM-dependent methyltransferase n=1 Tax=Pseudomonas sp. TaxID=306 RepID=UPI003392694A